MASIYVPVLREHGCAATFLSGSANRLSAPSLVVFVASDAPGRLEAVAEVASKLDMAIIRRLRVDTPRSNGTLLLFEPKEDLDTKAFWKAVGLPVRTLQKISADIRVNSFAMERAIGEHRVKFARGIGVRRDFFDPKPVGGTRFGCDVIDTALGRVAVHPGRGKIYREWEPWQDGRSFGSLRDFFFRATTTAELGGCARGAVRMMTNNIRFTEPTFRRLYEAVVAEELRDELPFTLWHEHVEAACVAEMMRAVETGRAPRDMAVTLNDHLPRRTLRGLETSRYDQFSTPLTVAAAAAAILEPQAGETLLEPMLGNGVLVSTAAALGAEVTGIEIDPARAQRAAAVLGNAASVVTAPFETWMQGAGQGARFDMVMANPPFSTDFEPRDLIDDHGRKIRLVKPDHFHAYQALRLMKDDGRAFIIIAADKMGEGKLDGSRRVFDNILRSNYHVAAAAVLHGRFYTKMGTQFPVEMYAIGPRRGEPLSLEETEAQAPEALPVLRTYDELQSWAKQATARIAELRAGREVAPAAQAAPPARSPQEGDRGVRQPTRWDEQVVATTVSQAFACLAEQKVLALPGGSAARIDAGATGWSLLVRDPSGNVSKLTDTTSTASGSKTWTRDTAIAAGIEQWVSLGGLNAVATASAPATPQAAAGAQSPAPPAPPVGTASQEDVAPAAAPVRGRRAPDPRQNRPIEAPGQSPRAEPAEPAAASTAATPPQEIAPRPPVTKEEVAEILRSLPKTVAGSDLVEEEDDPFLVPYTSSSQAGEATTYIQRSLASATMQALAAVERRYGDLDALVAQRFGFDRETMGTRLSPEQIDALAMSSAAADRGQGFLNADLMGVGKGRFFAAHVARAIMLDRPVIFMSDRPDLFQDLIARDLCDVTGIPPSELPKHIRPFIVNSSAEGRIYDYGAEGGPKLLFAHDPAAAAKARKDKAIPSTINLVMVSYSQFSHAGGDWKAEAIAGWMKNAEAPPIVLVDEAQRAAGESSRCGALVTGLINIAWKDLHGEVNYGSGTPLKSMRNIGVYKPILPDVGMSVDQLLMLVESNPLAMQEALSYEMARSGTFMSRELDQQGVQRQFVSLIDLNRDKYELLTSKMNEFSAFLGEMLEKSGEVKDTTGLLIKALQQVEKQEFPERIDEHGKLASQVRVTTNSPASRFHTISQYMMFALKANFAEEMVLDAIANGKKPILVVENVGDSMVRYMLDGLDDEGEEITPDAAAAVGDRRLKRFPNLGDLLIRTADAMLNVTIRNGFGAVEKERLVEHELWLEDFCGRVERADFSLLSTSGIDRIRETLAKYDFRGGELTRRQYELNTLADGTVEVLNRGKTMLPRVVRQFNEGEIDYAIMNRAASTGSSMQASPRTGSDLRPRRMIKLQLQSEVTQERQIDGRIHRTGQVAPGEYVVPMSGLAADDRLCALFNRKNRSMTSASQATRDNSTNISDAPDLLNPIGDKVVFNFLTANPALAARFGLDSTTLEPQDVARKFLGRLIVLPAEQQASLIAEIETSFRLLVADLEAKGENPLRLNQYDWGASVEVVKKLKQGDDQADSMAAKPLTLNKITFPEKVKPARWDELMERVETVREKWSPNGRFVGLDETFPELVEIRETGELDWSAGIFDRALNRSGGMGSLGLETIPSELAAQTYAARATIEKPNGLQKAIFDNADRALFLASIIEYLEPGKVVGLNPEVFPPLKDLHFYSHWSETHDSDAATLPAIVRNVSFSEELALNLGSWLVELSIPGEARTFSISLAQIYSFEKDALEKAQEEAIAAGRRADSAVGDRFFMDAGELSLHLRTGFDDEHTEEIRAARTGGDLEADRIAEIARSYFDRMPGGDILRTRWTLEGNIFLAVATATKEKLGAKVIYTTDTGEIRHAVLLKNDRISKMAMKLEHALQERSVPVPAHADIIRGAVETVRALHHYTEAKERHTNAQARLEAETKRVGERIAELQHRPQLAYAEQELAKYREQLVACLADAAAHPDDTQATAQAIRAKLAEPALLDYWVQPLTHEMVAAGRATGMVTLGVRMNGGELKKPIIEVSLTLENGFRVNSAIKGTETATLARLVASDRTSAAVVVLPTNTVVMTHAKGPLVTQLPSADFRGDYFSGKKLPAGVVVGRLKEREAYEDLVSYAEASSKEFSLHGPVRAAYETAQEMGRTIRKELEAELTAQAEAQAKNSPSIPTLAM